MPHFISPHFTEEEFACHCGCHRYDVDFSLIMKLENARRIAGIPFNVTSGCRCPDWNKQMGGKPTSAHLTDVDNGERCQAADIAITSDRERFNVIHGLMAAGFSRIGIGPDFVHGDIDQDKTPCVIFLY